MDSPSLVDRLAAHRLLCGVPRPQLEWFAARAELRSFDTGAVTYREGDDIPVLQVVLTGHLFIRSSAAKGSRKLAEWRGGDITGNLPYSRMSQAPGTVTAMEPTEMVTLNREHFRGLIEHCYELTQVLVHVMVDRARFFRANELQSDKMRSLGELSARLTHELNNPASAVARSARALEACLAAIDEASRRLGGLGLAEAQMTSITGLIAAIEPRQQPVSPMARAAREDAVADWFDDRDLTDDPAAPIADTPISVDDLDALERTVDRGQLPAVLRYAGSMLNGRRLAAEIDSAASRIHGLVSAVKRWTYMDQTDIPGSVNVAEGIADTVLMLGAKARAKKIELLMDLDSDLPEVEGFGGELNQVWLNLIDNAIDAAPAEGHVTVFACANGTRSLVVRVMDDGPGIAPNIRDRIFEPFFTTKPVGVGTGLGLDVARRVIDRHSGEIDLEQNDHGAQGTTFRVTLPTTWRPATPTA